MIDQTFERTINANQEIMENRSSINVKELRIGNLFQEEITKEIIEVTALNNIGKIYFSGDFSHNWQAEPIPVTKEWLLKFGAVKFGNGELSLNNHLIPWMDCRNVFIHGATSTELKYVHELQNLYFALTGEELQINN